MNQEQPEGPRHESLDHVDPTDAGLMDPTGAQVPGTGIMGDETLVRPTGRSAPGSYPFVSPDPVQPGLHARPGPTRWPNTGDDSAIAQQGTGTEETMTRDEILAAIDRERASWESLVASIAEDRMTEPGVAGDWTFKDVVAHLSGWRRRSLARLEAAARGEPEPPPPWPRELTGDDEINAWLYDESHARSLVDVLAEARTSFDRLATIVRSLPESDLTDPNRLPWLDGQSLATAITSGSFFGHFHEEHEPGIRVWIAGQPTG